MAALAGGGEGGANLGGVVAIVVNHGDAADGAAELKAAVDSSEMTQALGDLLGRNFKLAGNGDSGGGVEYVVSTGNVKLKGAERPRSRVDEEAAKRTSKDASGDGAAESRNSRR